MMRASILVGAATALAACTPQESVGGPPPSGWEPGPAYTVPEVHLFTADMVSDFQRSAYAWDGFGFGGCQPHGLVVGISHLYAPPPSSGDDPSGRLLSADERAAVLTALEGGMSLIRVDDGSRVPVRVDDGCVDVDGRRHDLVDSDAVFRSLVPEGPLADGWYVFRVDLSALRATGFPFELDRSGDYLSGGERVDDVLYARVRWGSQAAWTRVLFTRRRPDWFIAITASEPDPDAGGAVVEVRYDGEVISCRPPAGEVRPDEVLGIGVECPSGDLGAPPEGTTVQLTLSETDLRRPSGAAAGTLTVSYADYFDPNHEVGVLFEPEFAMDLVRYGVP